ncbi:MAG: T9SS type A sorting domain-containing protein [Bacteroidetes bacterium]|nr:T9SS type A sorting domain-containing protein [Bacteroidota bacterium]
MKKSLLLLLPASFLFAEAFSQNVNYVLQFDGSSNYVNIGTSAGAGVRSIEFWFAPSITITPATTDPAYTFIQRNDATQYHEYGFSIPGTDWSTGYRGYINFGMRDNGTLHNVTSNANTWSAGVWHHVAGVIDPATGVKLYIDGVLQTSTDPTGTVPIAASTEITAFGTWGDAFIRFYNGLLDEVRFWNRALSQTEIQQKMCYWLVPANETGLVGYWKMNEGSGTTVYDATSSSNNGTISGATFVQQTNCFTGYFGVNELESGVNISVFPNPVSSDAFIQSDKILKNATLTICNQLGQEVKTIENISGQTIQISCTDLSEGLYFVHLKQEGKILAVQKLVMGAQ